MKGTLERWITLDLEKQGVQARIPVRQGDALIHKIAVRLLCGGKKYIPAGAVLAQIYALLPDGKTVSCDGKIGTSGEVTFIPGGGFFACGGPVLCRLSLRGDDGGELYSPAFAFDVDYCFAADCPTVPAEEYSRLEELLLRTLAAQNVCVTVADEIKNGNYSTPLSDSAPAMDGEAEAGTSDKAARADHVHPTDTSRMPAMDQMQAYTALDGEDRFPVYSKNDGTMKKVLWGRMLALVRSAITSVASAATAESLTDPATGYKAALPELVSDNGVILLDRDLAEHNTSDTAHSDIRLLIDGIAERLNAIADSDDTTLDQLSELVAYIKDNRELIEQITTGKVSVADIVNNLTTNATDKPLSAAQGVALKALIDAIKVPTKLSELTDDAAHRTVTDAEKAAWDAKSDFSGSYNDLTDKPATEAFIFTLEDGSTVTKNVVVA